MTPPRTAILALVLLAAPLAGCASDEPSEALDAAAVATSKDPAALKQGRGAITGLLIDDRFRPLAGALILLQELGRTTSSNANGEFGFIDLPPGTYTLKASLAEHEAAPESASVKSGEYSEIQLVARRVESEGGTIITQEHSVFISCALDYVVGGGNYDCTLEQSEDSYSSSFSSNFTSVANVTYVVTEMKANQANRYEIQIRSPTPNGTERYSVALFEGDYVKIVNKFGVKNAEHEAVASYGENVPFVNAYPFDTIIFVDHGGREEVQGVWPANPGSPAWIRPCCGVGFSTGIKAKFVQSIFIGEPEVDVASYRVYN